MNDTLETLVLDLLLRISTLEKMLFKSGAISQEEYKKELHEITDEAIKALIEKVK